MSFHNRDLFFAQYPFIFFLNLYLFIYLTVLGLSCSMWNLALWLGTETRPPTLGAWSLNHWMTGKSLHLVFMAKWYPKFLLGNHHSQVTYFCCSVTKLCPTLCDLMDCSSMPGLPVLHYLPQFAQTHFHWVGDAIQPSHLLSSSSSPAFSLYQHQGLFQWVSSLHQVAKLLKLQLQHQSFQWIFRIDCL